MRYLTYEFSRKVAIIGIIELVKEIIIPNKQTKKQQEKGYIEPEV